MAFTTRSSLLSAIRRGDEISWEEFYEMYKPLILLRGGDLRLNPTEKEELVQLVMLSFFHTSQTFRYDRSKGRFRDYLRQLISHNAIDIIRRRKPVESSRLDIVEEQESPLESLWDKEWFSHIINQALLKIRAEMDPYTYQAFHLYVIEEKSADEVAQFLGLSKNSVYIIKSRTLVRLKQIVHQIKDT